MKKTSNIETIEQYRLRTAFMTELPSRNGFVTNPSLDDKVSARGIFKPFTGDTVIFPVHDAVFEEIQSTLYASCADMLAEERLQPETFHVTLHDLHNGMPSTVLFNRIIRSHKGATELLDSESWIGTKQTRLKAVSVFSMVGTSVVVGFEPETESDCTHLMRMYEAFQQVVTLPYACTLHLTLAYFKPGTYSEEQAARLADCMRSLTEALPQLLPSCITLDALPSYAQFASMNSYELTVKEVRRTYDGF